MPKKTYFNWSTGKDSALALYHILKNPEIEIVRLLTTINSHYNRVSMHGLRRELMEKQIEATGIPFTTIELPEEPDMETYEQIMESKVKELKDEGISDCAFGDIFLEDLRVYREKQLEKMDIKAHFPLWKRDTKELLSEFIDLGFKSIVICAKADLLDESFVGRVIDHSFIADLPENVDPCGENGEFHTFCFDGPIFKNPINFKIGETVFKSYKNPENCGTNEEDEEQVETDQSNIDKSKSNRMGFWYCDLLLEV